MAERHVLAAQAPRSFDYTDDARRDLGALGFLPVGRGRAIAYAWCKRERAYHLTDVRSNTRIPTHGKVRMRMPVPVGQSLGVCDSCGLTRPVHVHNDGHAYRASMGAIVTGTMRVGTYKDSRNPRVRALA